MQWFDLIGCLGVGLIVGSYFFLHIQYWRSTSKRFAMANAAGATLIIFSLCYALNWPSFVIECFWFVISAYGFVRNLRATNSHR